MYTSGSTGNPKVKHLFKKNKIFKNYFLTYFIKGCHDKSWKFTNSREIII